MAMNRRVALGAGRRGFTLVEVALAVAVGLIIIGGAVMGYNAVRENAQNTNARTRVMSAASLIEEYSAGNFGSYPDAARFQNMWASRRADDYLNSPWGGPIGTSAASGVVAADLTGFSPGPSREAAAQLPDVAPDLGNAAAIHYGRFGNGWATRTTTGASADKYMRNYFIGIFDKSGVAYFDLGGSQ